MITRFAVKTFLTIAIGGLCSSGADREHTFVSFDVSPDGRVVAFTPADGVDGLYALDLQTQTVRQLASVQGISTSPAFSPDGKEIAFAAAINRDKPFHLFVYSFATGKVSQITHESSVSDHDPSYSSDGSAIVFARALRQRPYSTGGLTWDNWDVVTIRNDGSSARTRTSRQYYQLTSPRFAPNDTQVVFSAMDIKDTIAAPVLMRASLQSSQLPTPVSPTMNDKACGSRGSDLQLSHDHQDMTFIADGQKCFAYDVYVVDHGAAGAKALGVTRISAYNKYPVFVPGTAQVMYLAGTQDAGGGRSRFSLYTVGRDGSEPHEVAGPTLFDDPLHWHAK